MKLKIIWKININNEITQFINDIKLINDNNSIYENDNNNNYKYYSIECLKIINDKLKIEKIILPKIEKPKIEKKKENINKEDIGKWELR